MLNIPEEQMYYIAVSHRPCRVAFLLDPDSTDLGTFDSIIDFCVDHWGGRYNPIIPVKDGAIYPEYKKLLTAADPDVIYHFSKLDDTTLEYLDWQIGPVAMEEHRNYAGNEANPHIHIDYQTSIKGLLLTLHSTFPLYLRNPEPSVLAFNLDRGENRNASRFVRWNFGVSSAAYFSHRDFDVHATVPPQGASDRDIIKIVSDTQNLALPIALAGNSPGRRALTNHARESNFAVFYGNSPWNLVEYWNNIFFRAPGQAWAHGMQQIWMPESICDDGDAFAELMVLLRRKVFAQHGSRRMDIRSYDHSTAELDQLAERLRTDTHGHLHRATTKKMEPGAFEGEVELPFGAPSRNASSLQSGKGRTVLLQSGNPRGIEPDSQDVWMVDLQINNPNQEKPYSNSEPWWKLPRRTWIAQTFSQGRPAKVVADGRLSLITASASQALGLTIPDSRRILTSLLLPNSFHHAAKPVRSRPDLGQILRTSDKGKYLNGVVSLFSSLSNASYVFENSFWRSLFEDLCCPKVSSQTRAKISHEIAAYLPQLESQVGEQQEETKSWLADLTIMAAHRIPIADNSVTFGDILEKYKLYVAQFPNHGIPHDEADLKTVLSDLTSARVLLQGCDVRCGSCMSNFWYHVDELKNELTCRGCRNEVQLPAESEWRYRPNELLRSAMRHHGVIPVIRVLGRLLKKSKDSFLWGAGFEYANYERDRLIPQAEVDLCWIIDGAFGLAEIKNSADGFSIADFDKMARIAEAIRPDGIVLAAIDGEDGKIEAAGRRLAASLAETSVNTEVKLMKPSEFSAAPPWAR